MAAGMSTTEKPTNVVSRTVHSMDKWIDENKQNFLPPVCLKMMYDDQLKFFFVGGPNQRKDYHLEGGEELFYQVRGDMVLKVTVNGEHRDIPIHEGEIFLLPSHVHHSPQRFANTVGFVAERARRSDEPDGVRYFVERDGKPTMDPLYEKYFDATGLGTTLSGIIAAYFASEEHRTGKPTGQHVVPNPPIRSDETQSLPRPFALRQFVDETFAKCKYGGVKKPLFDLPSQQSTVDMYFGDYTRHNVRVANGDTLIWCYQGSAEVSCKGETVALKERDMLLIPQQMTFSLHACSKSAVLLHHQETKRS